MKAVVAIPVRDEETAIRSCLDALLRQRDHRGHPLASFTFGIVVLFNNCTDCSVAVAEACLCGAGVPFVLSDVRLSPDRANAGTARRLAMDIAALWIERSGQSDSLLLTTDADSQVPNDWVMRNLEALKNGSRAVAGRARLDTDAQEGLPSKLLRRVGLEDAYEARLAKLAARLDPLAHDPWPNHRAASGASYAVTLDAYRAIGGLPNIPCGEDRALTRALERQDILIRHAPDIVVLTSARLRGRAQGGAADTLRARCEDPDLPSDPSLEPVALAARRFSWRRRLRLLHGWGDLGRKASWRTALQLPEEAGEWAEEPHFGSFWAHVEDASPRLAPHALRPSEIRPQIAAADMMLSHWDQSASRQSRR
ncbi:glycosyltransferase family 2 protein [Aquabacter sp. CN5-332]|uniref:glycosyltransferase n=1 Tax=Aquabacter sp. CN5-332 TaxID=3156608 RepID=UPI0032B384D5